MSIIIIIFFIGWVWFPNAFHSHSVCYVQQVPLKAKFSISTSEKELPVGSSTAPVLNGGGWKDGGWEDWIYINRKISLNFFVSCNLASTCFFFQCKVFLVPCFNLSFIQTMTYWKKRPFQRASLTFRIHCSTGLPFQLTKSLFIPYISLFHTLPMPPSEI